MAGRKLKYKKSYVSIAREACALGGLSNAKLGKIFGVSKNTVWHWRQKYPEFDAACKDGFESFAQEEARPALVKLVRGFRFTEVTKEPVKGKMQPTKQVTKQVPPNINAIKIVLDRYDKEAAPQQTGGEVSDLIAELDGTTRTLELSPDKETSNNERMSSPDRE